MERGTLHKFVNRNETIVLTEDGQEIFIKAQKASNGQVKLIINAPKKVQIGVKNG